jgi:hypothetical protein
LFQGVVGRPLTPQLYRDAVHRVQERGYSLSYNHISPGVEFHKIADIPPYQPAD